MGPYGSVWVRMVPGDLFQGFPGPNPLKNLEKYGFWGFGVGGGGGSPLILTYMALWPVYGLAIVRSDEMQASAPLLACVQCTQCGTQVYRSPTPHQTTIGSS